MSKTLINIANKYDRTIVLVDMDCFYCQVEEKLNPSLKGKPIAVVQYNAWKGGGIIAVNYAARDKGVTRHMRGDEAKAHCPDIELVKVPSIREKADLSKYRDAGKDVASVLQTFTSVLERASVDEAYLDITENVNRRFKEMNDGTFSLTPDTLLNSYAVGFENIGEFIQNITNEVRPDSTDTENVHFVEEDDDVKISSKYDIKLLIGASIVNEIRRAVKEKTGYECSAGIANNKILAKLVCGINKPNKQTVLPLRNISLLFSRLPVRKIKGLGGKFGDDLCETLNIKFMSELKNFTQAELQQRFDDKTGLWLFQMARGIDLEAVTPRFASKSIGCCKKFPGRNSIKGIATLNHWLTELAKEIIERLEKDEIENNRLAKQMVISFTQQINNEDVASTRSVPINLVDVATMAQDALDVIKKNTEVFFKTDQNTVLSNPIKFLGISVGKFEDIDRQKKNTIKDMFSKAIKSDAKKVSEKEGYETDNDTEKSNSTSKSECSSSIKSFFTTLTTTKDAGEKVEKEEVKDNNDATDEMAEIVSIDLNSKKDPSDTSASLTTTDEDIVVQNALYTENIPTENHDPNEPVAGPSHVIQPDYKTTYVEFLRPIIPDELFETCTQCNKKLLITEIQSHMDMHLAFQLSQEQRLEFRTQMKSKNSSSMVPAAKKAKIDRSVASNSSPITSAAKKSKIDRSAASNVATTDKGTLTKFLLKHDNELPESSVKCDQCGKVITFDEISEHSDYHAAKKLQLELNSFPSSSAINNNHIVAKTNKSGKPKPGSNSAANTRSVASFFKTSSN